MPVLESQFHPPLILRNPHVQTILPVLLPRRLLFHFARERMELSDGDFLDLDWLRGLKQRVAIISHGLEGSTANGYVRGTAAALHRVGWDVLAWNFRGCSGELNRLPRFYHSGETGDLGTVIHRAASDYATIALVGFSLGGNMTLKYLGEAPAHPAIVAAVAISTPVDLAASARALDQRPANRLYLQRFMKTLVAKIEAKATRFPQDLDATGARAIHTFQQFDDRYTARLHGFRDAEDYWARSSALRYLHGISIPTLLLNALDDPFLTAESLPFAAAERSTSLTFEAPAHGGHCGFLDLAHGLQRWSERRIVEFLTGSLPTSPAGVSADFG
ncbi:MAG: alpha/beta fold hydrolase [Chthoniobacteraceae bacterium]